MERREFLGLLSAAGASAMAGDRASADPGPGEPSAKKLVGMYVHECWVYDRPYAARSWTEADWRGYLDGLSRLGFNLISIWPQLEIVPDPPTASDRAKLELHRRVIEMAHREFGMKAWIIICPNNIPIDEYARRTTFEARSFSATEIRANPADGRLMDAMIARRERLLAPLAGMDGLVIIDSDPGGYPGSTNAEFVDLLVRHRKALDRIRPGIELVYWVWAGWQAYARFHATGEFAWGTDAEFAEVLGMLKEKAPEPWGIARGLEHAAKLGLESKVIDFNYGAIELEPVFPMTNFGPHAGGDPYGSGRGSAPRGTQANAQNHCLQLPGTFAFSRGARGLPLAEVDYARFADDLIRGQGERILASWKALAGSDSEGMRKAAAGLAPLAGAKLETGPLGGLLFGDAGRFLSDLRIMLRLKAAAWDLIRAAEGSRPLAGPLGEFVAWLDRWQVVTGYEGWWGWACGGDINGSLLKLGSPRVDAIIRGSGLNFMRTLDGTPMERIVAGLYRNESETLRLVRVLKRTLWDLTAGSPGGC